MGGISFKLEKFEGPLDLLLHLISKHKLNIYDIEISLLLEQYLEYMNDLEGEDYESVADFLEMAARLIYIKTCMLLPQPEESQELKKELEGRIIEYSLCKLAAVELRNRYVGGEVFVREAVELPVNKSYTRTHDVLELHNAYMGISSKIKRIKPVRANMFSPIVSHRIVSVTSKIIFVLKKLYKTGCCEISQLYDGLDDKSEKVATFLAVLELTKSGRIYITDDNSEIKFRRVNKRHKSQVEEKPKNDELENADVSSNSETIFEEDVFDSEVAPDDICDVDEYEDSDIEDVNQSIDAQQDSTDDLNNGRLDNDLSKDIEYDNIELKTEFVVEGVSDSNDLVSDGYIEEQETTDNIDCISACAIVNFQESQIPVQEKNVEKIEQLNINPVFEFERPISDEKICIDNTADDENKEESESASSVSIKPEVKFSSERVVNTYTVSMRVEDDKQFDKPKAIPAYATVCGEYKEENKLEEKSDSIFCDNDKSEQSEKTSADNKKVELDYEYIEYKPIFAENVSTIAQQAENVFKPNFWNLQRSYWGKSQSGRISNNYWRFR